MRAEKNHGFTIVELLVVITIIGLLMALLLPAVGAARRNAQEIKCVNQLRQLGLASVNYASKKDYFPGYLSELSMRNGSNETLIVPWFVQLLPFMERNDIYDAIQDPQKAGLSSPVQAATYLELAICPSDLPDTENQPHLSYVANMGVWDEQVKSTMQNGMGFRDRKANGVSHNLAGLLGRYSGIAAPARNTIKQQATNLKVSPSYVSSNDGTSTTMLMTENVDAGFWFATEQLPEDQGQYGVVWTSLTDQQYAINENAGLGSDTNVKIEFARPSSNHSGIVVVVFCDGHTLRLNEQVDREVYGRLMTPNGRESYLPSSSQNPPAFQVVPLSDTDLSN